MHKTPIKRASLCVLPPFFIGEDIENGKKVDSHPKKMVLIKNECMH